jgi:zinc transporter ZupT
MEARVEPSGETARRPPLARLPGWALALGAAALIALGLGAIALLGGDTLPERPGPPLEELAVERTELRHNEIALTLRNTGPDPVRIGQVFVNDQYVDFAGGEEPIGRLGSETLVLTFPWQEGQPYLVSLVTETGAVIEHEIPVAVETPQGDGDLVALMVLLGLYVGVIPVALGMLMLPAMRSFRARWIRLVLAVTIGLLAFLGVDATVEGLELAGAAGGAFGGVELVALGALLAFLALSGVDAWVRSRGGGGAQGMRLALIIAIGIGLHNLGEGIAIGAAYAVGELALGAALVLGFAIHNTTEGFAIVAPLVRERPSLARLVALGLIAGAPAIGGALLGVNVTNPELAALLFGVGVGAIAQVIVQLLPALRGPDGRWLDAGTATAVGAGALAFYLTGLLISV